MRGHLPIVYKDTTDMKTGGRLEVQNYPLLYDIKEYLLIRKTAGFGFYWPETPSREGVKEENFFGFTFHISEQPGQHRVEVNLSLCPITTAC